MCGCQHDNSGMCAKIKLSPGEVYEPCRCDCHKQRDRPIPDIPPPPPPASSDPRDMLASTFEAVAESLRGAPNRGPIGILADALEAVGNFAKHTKSADATAALCYAAADGIRAARKSFAVID